MSKVKWSHEATEIFEEGKMYTFDMDKFTEECKKDGDTLEDIDENAPWINEIMGFVFEGVGMNTRMMFGRSNQERVYLISREWCVEVEFND